MKHFSLTFLLSALAFLLSGNHAFAQFQRQYGSQGVTFQADKTGTLFSGATAGGEPFGFSEVAVVDSCSCPDGVLSQNLIANGSFTLGNVGFTSQLTGPSNCGPGRYGLVTNFSTFCSDWGPLGPHSGPNFMAIDGKDNGNTTILWQSPVSLTSQTDYCFSFFWALGFAHPSQNFPVSIDILDANGNVVTNAAYHVGDETIASSLTWKNKTINWNSTTIPNGNYFLAIRQLTGTAYRDWGIDDICFTKAKRACTANFTAKPLGINPCGLFQFTSTSIGAVSYSWDFGDPMSGTANNTSTEQIPTHQFSKCGMFTVCLTIKCADGTSSTVCYTVTVTDTILPVARCKPGVGVILNANCIYNVTSQFVDNGSSDNCKIQSMTVNPAVLTGCANHTVTLTVTDWCGNTSTCTMGIQTTEQVPPTMTNCPPPTTISGVIGANGICTGTLPIPVVTATDNCPGAVTVTNNAPTSGIFPVGTTTVIYTATDACKNTATCSWNVTVICSTPCANCPTGSLPGTNLVLNGDFELGNNGQFTSGYPYFTAGGPTAIGKYSVLTSAQVVTANSQWACTDHSAGTQMMIVDGSNSSSNVGWKNAIPIVVQQNKNYVFCAFVNNLVIPSRNYDDPKVEVWINGVQVGTTVTLPENPDQWVSIGGVWNSGIAIAAMIEIRVATNASIGNDFAIDDISFRNCASTTPCTANFTSQALGINPCGLFQFTSTSSGAVSYSWDFGDPMSGAANNTSTDQIPTHQFSKCDKFTVCLTIKCADGSTSTVCHTVTVTDNIPPVARCKPGVGVILNANCVYNVTSQFVDNGSSDNCKIQSMAVSPAVLTGCANHTVTLTVTDWCGNSSTCTMGIQTTEQVPPTMTCPPNQTVTCQTGLTPWPGVATATDNCPGAVAITFTDVTNGLMPCDAAVTRTWKGTDLCGNMSTCTQTVFVRDNVPPGIQCPPNSTVNTNPGVCYYQGNIPKPTSTDNCGGAVTFTCSWLTPTQSTLIDAQTQFTKGINNISCIANDFCGNGSQPCNFTLTVQDKEPPKITCPISMSVVGAINAQGQCKAVVNGLAPTVTDNCPMTTVTYTIAGTTTATGNTDASGTMFMQGLSTVTYTVTDMGGNKATCSFTIDVKCPPGDCTCIPNSGGFTNMSYRPNSGPNQPIACGQLAVWQCALANFTMGGNFACQGNNCPPAGTSIPMFWTLKKGLTPVTNGTMSGSAFNVAIPSSSFTTSGVYTLTLGGICGKDTCYCDIKIETPGCGDCTCLPNGGGFTNMSYRPNSGPNQPIACGQLAVWQCALANFTLGGNFACQGNNCPPAGTSIPMFWTLKKGSSPIINSGTMTGSAFNVSIPSSSFATAGVYILTLAGICGKDTCYCEIKIETPGCGDCNENNCLHFDGTNDFVSVPSPIGAAPAAFSVGCWFRDDRMPPATDAFFYRLFGWTGANRFELGDKNGFLSFFSNLTGPNEVISTANIRDGRWHYVVATYSGNQMNAYFDGNSTPVLSLNIGGLAGLAPNFHVGDWGGGASDPRFWMGCIDEFKVWNTALTPAQVADAMQCSADPSNANLLLHFPFNQGVAGGSNGSVNVALDTKGTNNGNLTGFALNGATSNWLYRGVSQLPTCQAIPFIAIEGNQVSNTAYRTKIYNGQIYSLSTEAPVGNIARPAFIKRDPSGTMTWRTMLSIRGYANDFVMTQDGCDFLIVGHDPAFTGNNTAWIARVRDIDGSLVWLHTFNLGQRESFTRIILSDNPAVSSEPYVILGVVNNGGTADDIHLFTVTDAGIVTNARRYNTGGDDEFFKDLVQMQGSYVMAGNIATTNRSVLVFTGTNLVPQPARTFQLQPGPYIWDVEPTFNEKFLLIAGQIGNDAFLAKIEYNFPNPPVPIWAHRFPGISSFRKVTIRPNGEIHALGLRRFSPANPNAHNVIIRGQDNGNSLTVNWLKYFYRAPETNWTLGDIVHYNGQNVYYTDGRLNNPATYGNFDIFKVLCNNDLSNVPNNCMVLKGDFTMPAIQLVLTPVVIPSVTVQMTSVAAGSANPVPLPMRDPCKEESCECKYESLAFSTNQQVLWKNFTCGAPPLDLPCPDQNQVINFSGKLTCLGNCKFTGLTWVIKDPNTGTVVTGSSATPAFNIPITLSMLQITGVYTIELTGKCGTKECKCVIQFRVKECPKACACTPLAAFQADVNMGFNYFKFPTPSCKYQFTPKKLTACDKVQWKVAKASDLIFTVVGTTVGNAPFQYTFPTDLTQYVVCIDVTRTVPGTTPPLTCKQSRCYTIDLDCSLFTGVGERGGSGACAGSVVRNGGFTQGAEAGGMLSGGTAYGWKVSGGDPEIVMEPGQSDTNFVRLRGNRLYSDRLYQDSLPTISGKSQLSFAFRPILSTLVEGSELVVRLSKEPQDSSICIGDCQEIMRFPIPVLDSTFSGVWLTAFSGDSITVAGKYLTFQVENPFTDDDEALKSVLDIDNICLRNVNFVPTKDLSAAAHQFFLYPNPTTGELTVEWPGLALQKGALQLVNSVGQAVRTLSVSDGATQQRTNVTDLPSGIYFIKVLTEGRLLKVLKFVKQ